MKKFLNNFHTKKFLVIYKRVICLKIALIFLFNLTAEAYVLVPKQLAPQEIQEELKIALEEVAPPQLSPKEYLHNLNETLNNALEDADTKTNPEENIPTKKTKEVFTHEYKKELEKQYKQYIKDIDEAVQTALAEFDKTAFQEIENIKTLLIKEENKNKPVHDLFAEPNIFEESLPPFLPDGSSKS